VKGKLSQPRILLLRRALCAEGCGWQEKPLGGDCRPRRFVAGCTRGRAASKCLGYRTGREIPLRPPECCRKLAWARVVNTVPLWDATNDHRKLSDFSNGQRPPLPKIGINTTAPTVTLGRKGRQHPSSAGPLTIARRRETATAGPPGKKIRSR